MSKRFNAINGSDFIHMVLSGADNLRNNVNKINALNVFPVPDGDTGTNMNMTMTSGMEELKKRPNPHIGKAADILSKGLLMGARGNSGVILSQLFRGFAKAVQSQEAVTPQQFAAALQQGVDTAYQAVVKPVEGTILTVAKESARHAGQAARRFSDVAELMKEVLQQAKTTLSRTPEMLPVLKQVGVVDAGGQGLVCVYEGFLAALTGEAAPAELPSVEPAAARSGLNLAEEAHSMQHAARSAQSMLSTDDIEHGYCTEFIVRLSPGGVFREADFRRNMAQFGDSLLVVADDELVKIHIHAESPGSVMNFAMKYGDLTRIKIENMREQHSHIIHNEEYGQAAGGTAVTAALPADEGVKVTSSKTAEKPETAALKPYGFAAVALGGGIAQIFESLGVDQIISGGQTMNPSTEDIVRAVRSVRASTVFVLPNNSNIVLAAQQARDLVEGQTLVVIPTKSIPQGIAALIAFQEQATPEQNESSMQRAIGQVVSGQITYAVRDTAIDGLEIREGDYIGIMDGKLVVSERDLDSACRGLLDRMLEGGAEIVTVYAGEDAAKEQTEAIAGYLNSTYADAEVEVHDGGQPLYVYIFSVE